MRLGSFLVVFTMAAPATAQPPSPRPDPAANAAIKYWQAFALLPALDKDQEKLLQEWDKVPLDAAAVKLIGLSQHSLKYLHRGAGLTRCDWSLDYQDGIGLLVPHLGKARTLAKFAALRARHEFSQGQAQAGWDDVTALLRLARHVETDPLMIGQLVGYAIEGAAIQAASPYLPDSKAMLAAAAADLDRLPAGPTFAQMLQIERRTAGDWLIGELRAAERMKPGSWEKMWNSLLAGPGEGGAPAAKAPEAKSLDEAVKLLEGLPSMYDEMARLTELPWAEFDNRYAEFMKTARAKNAAAAAVLPAMDHMVAAKRRADARIALFKAAVAVVQGGPDRLKDIKDPFGDGPFEYKPLDRGFELRSKLTVKGEPVTLTVGKK